MQSLTAAQPMRAFDDELALSLFKLALIERYCREQISASDVENIFAEIEQLRAV